MTQLWSPLKAALVAFLIVALVGSIVGIVVMNITGTIHDQPFERGQMLGRGVGPVAALAAVIAYFVQKKRMPGL